MGQCFPLAKDNKILEGKSPLVYKRYVRAMLLMYKGRSFRKPLFTVKFIPVIHNYESLDFILSRFY